jgi:hypothetical protein
VSYPNSLAVQLRNLGVPLAWSWTEDVQCADPRFAESQDDVRFWNQVRPQPEGFGRCPACAAA